MIKWFKASKIVREEYGMQVDYDEEFFICPECGEPIYEEDYMELKTEIKNGNTYFVCPICEEYI